MGYRQTGWAPLGKAPLQVAHFHRDQRYQILPAYAKTGIVLSRVSRGPTDATAFKDFVSQLLQHCGGWSEPRSVLIMDNASLHRSERLAQMCADEGVKSIYLPPYSPDLNPIEEFFAELKRFIKRSWNHFEQDPEQEFYTFQGWCIRMAGAKEEGARRPFSTRGSEHRKPRWQNPFWCPFEQAKFFGGPFVDLSCRFVVTGCLGA